MKPVMTVLITSEEQQGTGKKLSAYSEWETIGRRRCMPAFHASILLLPWSSTRHRSMDRVPSPDTTIISWLHRDRVTTHCLLIEFCILSLCQCGAGNSHSRRLHGRFGCPLEGPHYRAWQLPLPSMHEGFQLGSWVSHQRGILEAMLPTLRSRLEASTCWVWNRTKTAL